METDKYYFFWKHRLSQWHMVDFVVDGKTFCCTEQFMMFKKAMLFNDPESAQKIINTRNPRDHQLYGRQVKNFDQKVWNVNKYEIVLTGNHHRFTQSKICRDLLFSTGNKKICEASPYDVVWGVGLAESDQLILDEANWRGQNLLGKILTQVRDNLRTKPE